MSRHMKKYIEREKLNNNVNNKEEEKKKKQYFNLRMENSLIVKTAATAEFFVSSM
jgi:hypothetical protein